MPSDRHLEYELDFAPEYSPDIAWVCGHQNCTPPPVPENFPPLSRALLEQSGLNFHHWCPPGDAPPALSILEGRCPLCGYRVYTDEGRKALYGLRLRSRDAKIHPRTLRLRCGGNCAGSRLADGVGPEYWAPMLVEGLTAEHIMALQLASARVLRADITNRWGSDRIELKLCVQHALFPNRTAYWSKKLAPPAWARLWLGVEARVPSDIADRVGDRVAVWKLKGSTCTVRVAWWPTPSGVRVSVVDFLTQWEAEFARCLAGPKATIPASEATAQQALAVLGLPRFEVVAVPPLPSANPNLPTV